MEIDLKAERIRQLEAFLDEICEYYYREDAYECICPAQADAAQELEELQNGD
jgi:hypothetical protein